MFVQSCPMANSNAGVATASINWVTVTLCARSVMGDDLPTIDLGTGRSAQRLADSMCQTTFVILDDGSLKGFGENSNGNAGAGVSSASVGNAGAGDSLPAVNLGTCRTAKRVASSDEHTCAILDDDTLKCWGTSSSGNPTGSGDTTTRGQSAASMGDNLSVVDLGTGHVPAEVVAGRYFTCVLLTSGNLKCFGFGSNGGLGYGDLNDRGMDPSHMGDNLPVVNLGTGRTALKIGVGDQAACALLDDFSVKCWGWQVHGVLGSESASDFGDAPGSIGDHLPTVNLGTGRTAKDLAVGERHACAVLDNDSIKCWGQGTAGALGTGDTAHRGRAAGTMGDNLPAFSLGTGRTVKKMRLGYESFGCAILDDDSVKCWGQATSGRLGYGDTANRGDAAGEMDDNLPVIDLGIAPTTTTVVTTTTTSSTTMSTTTSGSTSTTVTSTFNSVEQYHKQQ